MNYIIALYRIKLSKQIGKIIVKSAIDAVRIYVLTEKRDILIAQSYKLRKFGYYILASAASLPPSDIGYYTV